MIYPPKAKNPFSILTRIASEEPLMIVSVMMDSSREGSPRRTRIIVHHPKVARDQSATKPRGSKDQVRERYQ